MNTMLRATALGVVALLLGIFCILVRYDQIISVATEFTIVAAILLIAASFVVVKISLSPLKVSITPDSERSDRHKQGIASFGIGEALFVETATFFVKGLVAPGDGRLGIGGDLGVQVDGSGASVLRRSYDRGLGRSRGGVALRGDQAVGFAAKGGET